MTSRTISGIEYTTKEIVDSLRGAAEVDLDYVGPILDDLTDDQKDCTILYLVGFIGSLLEEAQASS